MKTFRWIKATPYSQAYCENCRLTPKTIFGRLPPYCPNCGKKMQNEDWIENKQAESLVTYPKQIVDDCKKFLGITPYNTYNNVVMEDPHFLKSLQEKYGKDAVDTTIIHLTEADY